MGGPGAKKFFLAGPWDLEIATNAIMFERQPILHPHPHPEVEALRYNYVMKLRQSFQEMCHSREGELSCQCFFTRTVCMIASRLEGPGFNSSYP